MAAEHDQILAAAPRILLAAAAEFEHLSDPPILDQVAGRRVGGRVPVDVGQRELGVRLLAGRDHSLRFSERADERLLHEDALHSGLRGRDRHLRMAVDLPHADRDDVGLGRREHRLPVSMSDFRP